MPKPRESVIPPVAPEVSSGYEAATDVTPELVSVVPPRESPEPMVSVLTGDAPLPRRMPVSVVEPVPPLATVSALVRLSVPIQAVVEVKSVEVAFAKVLRPVKELLLARRVEEAAVIVAEPPRPKVVPLMVETPALVKSELPMVEVATTEPLAFTERREFVSEVMAKEVDVPKPRVELLAERFVVDAVVK